MRIRILDRILVAVAGILLLAACAAVSAQIFFGINVTDRISALLSREDGIVRILVIAGIVLLFLLGAYCFLVLFRHRGRKGKFVLQKTDNGDLAISLKAMESMVNKCLEQVPEVQAQHISLMNQKDGLLICIRGSVSGGISIPLTVEALQKQIRQYVTACSGVEIKGIRIQIDSSGQDATEAPFVIAPPVPTPLLRSGEKASETAAVIEAEAEQEAQKKAEDEALHIAEDGTSREKTEQTEKVSDTSAVERMIAEKAHELELTEEDDRPMHQRLFSTPEEPCVIPMPPEMTHPETETNGNEVQVDGDQPDDEKQAEKADDHCGNNADTEDTDIETQEDDKQ